MVFFFHRSISPVQFTKGVSFFFWWRLSPTMQVHNYVTIGLSSLTNIMYITIYFINM